MPTKKKQVSVVFEDRAADFISQCEAWLVRHERDNNDILSVAYAIESRHPSFHGENVLARLDTGDGICGCFIITASGRIHLPDMPGEILQVVCADLIAREIPLRQISATGPTAVEMAKLWSSATGDSWKIDEEWQAFRVDEVVMPDRPAHGVLRLADDSERELVEAWGNDYGEEQPAPIDVATFLLGKMDVGELYLWDDNGPRVLVAVSAKTKHCARVSAVYTPLDNRRRGYASIAVATASCELLLAGAQVCSLSVAINDTDVMRIYEKIGYRKTNIRTSIQLLNDRLH